MANVLNEEKKQQVLALGRLGWSLRRIQQATRIRRETASAHLKAAGIAVRPPSGWGRRAPKPANEVITDSGAAKPAIPVIPDPLDPNLNVNPNPNININLNPNANPNPNPENLSTKGKAKATSKPANEVITDSELVTSPSACEPYREAIDLGLSRGRNARAIWQDLVSEYGFASSYQSVQRFVRKRRGTQTPEARVVIVTAPGREAQVDYGTGPMVRDPENRKYRRTRLFVMTLGCSRKSVRLLTFRSSSRIWAELHERAFRRLGGATRIVVLDNLREGVLVPDIYDPALNPLYRDVLAHYGAVAMPCRIQDPDRKGKVESGVGHAQRTPLKGLRFESLEEAQAHLDHWEQRWADTRIHGTTKRQVAAMFAEEKPTLLPLPLEPFRYYQYGERIVHLDGCVEVEAAYYGAPPGWIGRVPRCNGMNCMFACSIPKPGNCCANTCARGAAGIASKKRITRSGRRCALPNCCGGPVAPGRTSERSATPSIASKARSVCAASWAFFRWLRSTAPRRSMRPAPLRWKWESRNIALSAAIWNAAPKPHSVCSKSIP
jgi:transposase